MDSWGVDIAVAGSQKGFMLPTGLAIVAVSQRALEARRRATFRRCFFDFDDMMRANETGYFPTRRRPRSCAACTPRSTRSWPKAGERLHAPFPPGAGRAPGRVGLGLELYAREPKRYSDTALAGAEMALADCGVDLELGSGVAAAQAWFRSCGADKLNSAA